MSEQLYDVTGGTGSRYLVRGVPIDEAERIRDEFDNQVANYGLIVPPTRIIGAD